MVKIAPMLRFAASGAIVLGLACCGFVASASAQNAPNAADQKPQDAANPKPATDVTGTWNQRNNNYLRDSAGNPGGPSSTHDIAGGPSSTHDQPLPQQ